MTEAAEIKREWRRCLARQRLADLWRRHEQDEQRRLERQFLKVTGHKLTRDSREFVRQVFDAAIKRRG